AIWNCLQIRSTPCSALSRSMKAYTASEAVELPGRSIRCCEKCRRLAEDLVRPPELRVLPLQRLEPYSLVGGEPRTLTHVHHPAPHPVPQGLRRAADLRGDGENGSPLGFVLVLVLEDEPHRALTDFRRKGCST